MSAAGSGRCVDTSVLVAALVRDHADRPQAAPHAAEATTVLAPVVIESWSVLRRAFRLHADTVAALLRAYLDTRELHVPSADVYDRVLRTGRALQLAGDAHDAVTVQSAREAGLHLVTLDPDVHRLADGVVWCTLLEASAANRWENLEERGSETRKP